MKKIITIFWILLITFSAKSQIFDDFEENLSINNYGKKFHLSVPPSLQDENNSQPSYIRLFIGSIKRTKVTIEVPAKSFKKNITINPGEINEVVMPPEIAQPYIKQGKHPAEKSRVYLNAGINVISEEDIFIYVLADNNASNEGYLALPATALGSKYVVSSYGDGSYLYPVYTSFPSITTIVGNYNNTVVNFTLGGNSSTTTAGGLSPYQKESKVLNSGDVWVISTQGNFSDLSGSVISSSKPVSVISGNQSASIPIDNKGNDYIVEMLAPIDSWGTKYYGFSIFNKSENPVYRLYSKYDSTDIYVNGEFVTEIFSSGGIEGIGYREYRPDTESGKLSIFSSDKPIDVQLYNTGSEEDGLPKINGGPFQMRLIPYEQFSRDIIITMPGTDTYNSGFDKTFLVVISKNVASEIIISEINQDNENEKNLDEMNIIENDIFTDGTNYYLIEMPARGLFRLKSSQKLASYIYGINNRSAFGYPGSSELKFLVNDNIPPKPEWNLHCNGDTDGIVTDLPEGNASNLANVIVDRMKTNNYEFQIDKIIPGVTNQAEWQLKVKNHRENAQAVITFRDKSNNDTTIKINYKAPNVELIPDYHHFGSFVLNDETDEANFKEFRFVNHSDTLFEINRLEFLKDNAGFAFSEEFSHVTLNPGEEFRFTVFFNPVNSGLSYDSIGIGNECFFSYLGYVEAEVGVPVIEVTDAEFNNIFEGDIAYRDIQIHNRGKIDLLLEDYRGTFSNNFTIVSDIDFAPSNPVVIKPGESYGFKVQFENDMIGQYSDSVIIKSNADEYIDNVAMLYANVIPQGLTADSYDWKRKRINRTDFPAGPYPVLNEYSGIKLNNMSDENLTITGFEIIESTNGEAFEFSRGQLQNLRINAGESFVFPVRFRPEEIGNHKLVLEYRDNKGGKARTTLRGTGVVPKLHVEDVNFDTCVIESYDNYKQMDITIRNLGYSDWDFADTLNLFNLLFDENLSETWLTFNDKPFKINYPFINFPKQILPGNSFVIRVAFVPLETGYTESTIKINSDALNSESLKLFGYGINHDIVVKGAKVSTCINTPVLFESLISNKSSGKIEIESVELLENNNGFSFDDPSVAGGFSLQPDEEKRIKLYFNPLSLASYENEIIVSSKSQNIIKRSAKLEGNVDYVERNVILTPTSKTGKIGEKTKVSIKLNEGEDISEYRIKELDLIIEYNSSMLKIEKEDITAGNNYKGKFEITSKNIDPDNGVIKLKLSSFMDNFINDVGNLAELNFYVLYPLDSTKKSLINAEISSNADECVKFKSFSSKIDLEPVCVDDLRKFNISGYDYDLQEISPNPVKEDKTEINYTLAIEAHTRLELFNAQGEMVMLLKDGVMQPGNFSTEIDLSDLASGVYFYRLKSGPYMKSLPLVISK